MHAWVGRLCERAHDGHVPMGSRSAARARWTESAARRISAASSSTLTWPTRSTRTCRLTACSTSHLQPCAQPDDARGRRQRAASHQVGRDERCMPLVKKAGASQQAYRAASSLGSVGCYAVESWLPQAQHRCPCRTLPSSLPPQPRAHLPAGGVAAAAASLGCKLAC